MKKRVNLMLFALLTMVVCMSGCATMGLSTDPVVAAKQQGILWMSVYNAEYKDVASVLSTPTSTASQRALAEQKKVVLTKAYPWLVQYKKAIDGGITPTTQNTDALVALMNELVVLSGGI